MADSSSDTLRQDERAQARAAALSGPRIVAPASIPGYQVQRCLGTGAYGSVWLANERNTGKQVAIKFYSHRRGIDWSLLNREVEKLAVLYTSRDIVGLLQVGWDADPPYYVMEFLQNGSLSRQLEQGALPPSDALRIATAVTGALVHAHQHGILHCDVKPANVLLDGDFAPRLADFGQSRLSHEQSPALGTLFYMAPEQADLNAIPDPRWDVYALGALLYHMLTGAPPFRTPDNERKIREAASLDHKLAAYRQIVERGPRPTLHRGIRGVDTRLADIVDRCLAVDPARRFTNAAEVAAALDARARYRALRPMIWFGAVLPGLLLLLLLPLAFKAVDNAADTAERNLAQRATESDAVAAKFLAYSLNDDLEQRLRSLKLIADYPDLQFLTPGITAPPDSEARRKLQEYLDNDKARIDQIRQESKSDLDESWFLTDAEGFQRWRSPAEPATQEKNYAWRDYFHGQGADHPEWAGRREIRPLEKPHISAPYRSVTGQFKVALSVPIRDAAKPGEPVIGVLSRSIQLGKFLGSYKQLIDRNASTPGERVIALLNFRHERFCVLDHPWMTADNLLKLEDDEVFDRLTVWPGEQSELEALRTLVREGKPVGDKNIDRQYDDPVAKIDAEANALYGMPWLAAFWPVGDTGWFAVVQEKRDDALSPVREIQENFFMYGLAGVMVSLSLAATSWYFILRVMRAQAVGSRIHRVGGNSRTSLTGSLTASGSERR